jgi:hypothetical protein
MLDGPAAGAADGTRPSARGSGMTSAVVRSCRPCPARALWSGRADTMNTAATARIPRTATMEAKVLAPVRRRRWRDAYGIHRV